MPSVARRLVVGQSWYGTWHKRVYMWFLTIRGSRDVWIWWPQPTLPLSAWCAVSSCWLVFSSSFTPGRAIRITSLNSKINGSHVSLPPSSVHRMTGWVAISRILQRMYTAPHSSTQIRGGWLWTSCWYVVGGWCRGWLGHACFVLCRIRDYSLTDTRFWLGYFVWNGT